MPKTGYSHPRCYARALADCSRKISKEHFLSQAILNQISVGGRVGIADVSWVPPGEFKELPTAVLGSKILCEKHNRALSHLDAVSARFYSFLSEKTAHQPHTRINGNQLERWSLKLLCGLIASGSVRAGTSSFHNWYPPKEWLRILFGSMPLPSNCGLHYLSFENMVQDGNDLIKTSIISDSDSSPIGLLLVVEGVPFISLIDASSLASQPAALKTALYHHPNPIRVKNTVEQREIDLGWVGGKTIMIDMIAKRLWFS